LNLAIKIKLADRVTNRGPRSWRV